MEQAYGNGGWMLPVGLLSWLATSEVRMWVYGLRPLYGVVRFLHLAGMTGFLGAVLVVDLRLLGLFQSSSLSPARSALAGMMHWGFGLTVVTGIALFLYNPLGAGLHSMFLPKLLLIALGVLHVHGIRGREVMRTVPALRRAAAAASLVIWVGVVGASTWNHMERPVSINAALRANSVGKE